MSETWLREGIEKIEELAKTEIIEVDGRKYSTAGLNKILEPTPASIKVKTLTGVVDYFRENRDGLDLSTVTVRVDSFNRVEAFCPVMRDNFCERAYPIEAEASLPNGFTFGQWMSIEDFNIRLMSLFTNAGDRDSIMKVTGRVTAETSVTVEDDGISQAVEAKTGVTKVQEVVLSPIVNLAPFRTFAEVDQPVSKFLFRMRRDGNHVSAALFEADGGAWRLEAMKNIAEYLGFNLPKDVVVIA